ncbi:MAG: hypothetical protein A2017_17380 [Lentisphaerae bacterium GWF2_44_16]|nr:MAG: hypothetical protein A2017_17380 [Lentisphaerae bacterium GWF2_44_16]
MVTPVIFDDITSSVSYIAQAVADEEVDLIARVEGFLEKRNFEEGNFVKKGDVLLFIERAYYKAKVDAAKAQVEQENALLKDALIEYDRQKSLFAKSAVSKRDFEKAETNKASLEAKKLADEANLELARLNLSYTEIKAPFDGRMGKSFYSAGNLVNPSSGKLATIVKTGDIKVEFYISEALLAEYLNNKKDKAKDSIFIPSLILPDGSVYGHKGKIDFIDNKINSSTGTILLRSKFPNPDNILIPGMYVKIILTDKEHKKSLLIPSSAIQEDQSGKFVMIVDKQNKVQTRKVETGTRAGINIVIEKGLNDGELVITEGMQKVRAGMTVTPIRDNAVQNQKTENAAKGEKNNVQ